MANYNQTSQMNERVAFTEKSHYYISFLDLSTSDSYARATPSQKYPYALVMMISAIPNSVPAVPNTNHRFKQINFHSIREWLVDMTSDPMRQENISYALLHITESYFALRIKPPYGFFESVKILEFQSVVVRYEPEPWLVEVILETFFYYLLQDLLCRYGILHSAERCTSTIPSVLTDISNQGDDKFQLEFTPAVRTIPIWNYSENIKIRLIQSWLCNQKRTGRCNYQPTTETTF